MKRLFKLILLTGVTLALLGSLNLIAQGGGGRGNRGNRGTFDPAQAQQRLLDRYRELLEVTDDAEWKVISAAVEKVNAARREMGGGGLGLMGRGGRGGRRGGGANGPDATNTRQDNSGRNPGRGRFGTPLPEAEALQKALADKAPTDELKAKLAAYLAARKQKLAAVRQAQAELKKLLTVRQEATAHLVGLLSEVQD